MGFKFTGSLIHWQAQAAARRFGQAAPSVSRRRCSARHSESTCPARARGPGRVRTTTRNSGWPGHCMRARIAVRASVAGIAARAAQRRAACTASARGLAAQVPWHLQASVISERELCCRARGMRPGNARAQCSSSLLADMVWAWLKAANIS